MDDRVARFEFTLNTQCYCFNPSNTRTEHEDVKHLFNQGDVAKKIWRKFAGPFRQWSQIQQPQHNLTKFEESQIKKLHNQVYYQEPTSHHILGALKVQMQHQVRRD